jgi:hypothetical protein
MIRFANRLFNHADIEVIVNEQNHWMLKLRDGTRLKDSIPPYESKTIPVDSERFEVISVFHVEADEFIIDRIPVIAWHAAISLSDDPVDNHAEPITTNPGNELSEHRFLFDTKTGKAWIPFESDGDYDSILDDVKSKARGAKR